MVQRSGEGPLLPEQVAIALQAELGDRCRWGVSLSGNTLYVDGIARDDNRRLFRFGSLGQPITRIALETCLRRFGLSSTGMANYLFQRLPPEPP